MNLKKLTNMNETNMNNKKQTNVIIRLEKNILERLNLFASKEFLSQLIIQMVLD